MCINFLIPTSTYSNIGFLISKKKLKYKKDTRKDSNNYKKSTYTGTT